MAACNFEKTLQAVQRIKRDMEHLMVTSRRSKTPVSSSRAFSYVTKLEKLHMTWEILKRTKVGFTVNDVRKACLSGLVKRRGKDLLKSWRKLGEEEAKKSTQELRRNHDGATREETGTSVDCIVGSTSSSSNVGITVHGDKNDHGLQNTSSEQEHTQCQWKVTFSPGDESELKLTFTKTKYVENESIENVSGKRFLRF